MDRIIAFMRVLCDPAVQALLPPGALPEPPLAVYKNAETLGRALFNYSAVAR